MRHRHTGHRRRPRPGYVSEDQEIPRSESNCLRPPRARPAPDSPTRRRARALMNGETMPSSFKSVDGIVIEKKMARAGSDTRPYKTLEYVARKGKVTTSFFFLTLGFVPHLILLTAGVKGRFLKRDNSKEKNGKSRSLGTAARPPREATDRDSSTRDTGLDSRPRLPLERILIRSIQRFEVRCWIQNIRLDFHPERSRASYNRRCSYNLHQLVGPSTSRGTVAGSDIRGDSWHAPEVLSF
ncbi:hypothetical protein EVAR_66168_1 [Eumeta japonica]|uniref:Uncharacterized protein n=1 Tax=Eumeta variegata TaxID=151549 RepID=A0A4C1ZQ93_EUMVA|nr:hypothetical protein EVAR_66168_1 [Eumeta japonica]